MFGSMCELWLNFTGEDSDGPDDGRRRRYSERHLSVGSESDVPFELDHVAEEPVDESPTVGCYMYSNIFIYENL